MLEGAAGQVAAGQSYQGVYKFDSITVHGGARVVFGDTDELGSSDVDSDSELWGYNAGPPDVQVSVIQISVGAGSYQVTGGAGAVTDPDGIVSVTLHNLTTDDTWAVSLNGDGSFGPVTIAGSAGDVVELTAIDAHPYPRGTTVQIGTLPANGAPVIDQALISYSVDGTGQYHMVGAAGAVTDDTPPLTVTVTDTAIGDTWSAQAASDGSFDVTIASAWGEPLNLAVTDSAPQPQTTMVDMGSRPDLVPPALDATKLLVTAHDRSFWVAGTAGSIAEADGVADAHLEDPAQPGVTWSVSVQPDGSFAETAVSAGVGATLNLSVTDVGGNTTTTQLAQALPANGGPPVIDTSYITTEATAAYRLGSDAVFCFPDHGGCMGVLRSVDGLENVHLEDRTTPGFGPWPVAPVLEPGSGEYYAFDPVTIGGAEGDEIWLVAEDGHPVWQSAEEQVWTLPHITGAPSIDSGGLSFSYDGVQYRLVIASNALSDPNGPLSLDAKVWRQSGDQWNLVDEQTAQIDSGAATNVPFSGAAEGDLVILSATDTDSDGPRTTTVRVGSLPAPVLPELSFSAPEYLVGEGDGAATITVHLSRTWGASVTVDYMASDETANAGQDYDAASGTLSFAPGETEQSFSVAILDDSTPEPIETVQLALSSPSGAVIVEPASATLAITDDDGQTQAVTYSVDPEGSSLFNGAMDVSITNGWASFAESLPGREGDQLTLGTGDVLFLQECVSPELCRVALGDGSVPADVTGGTVTEVRPAFSSLAGAVAQAGDADHLGTFDLSSAGLGVRFVCYFRGSSDTTPVLVDGWTTSPGHGITITAHDRHSGAWSPGAYNLTVTDSSCITSTVGNLTLEGLQLHCSGASAADIEGVLLTGPDVTGTVDIATTIIRLDAATGTGKRIGIDTESVGNVVVRVRNSLLYDLGSGNVDHSGILASSDSVTLDVASTTVYGGEFGVRQTAGAAIARNVLAVDAATGCFAGAFSIDSTNNVSSDQTAPGVDTHADARVSFINPVGGDNGDYHLACTAPDQGADISEHSAIDFGNIEDLYDGNIDTGVRSAAVNPAHFQVVFPSERTVTGTRIFVTNAFDHEWQVEAADSVADMQSKTGSYRVIVPTRYVSGEGLPDPFRLWDEVVFGTPVTARVFRLTVHRLAGDDFVHVTDWILEGINPACGTGLDLSTDPQSPFFLDVDGRARTEPWDVGADQARDLAASLEPDPPVVWETEGQVTVDAVLSEAVPYPVHLPYAASASMWGQAEPGVDFEAVHGVLTFPPGTTRQSIVVPIYADSEDDDPEDFHLEVGGADSTVGVGSDVYVYIHDGAPPPRVSLAVSDLAVAENAGSANLEVSLSEPSASTVTVEWGSREGTAWTGVDFGEAHGTLTFAPGVTSQTISVPILDDTIPEQDETVRVMLKWADGAQLTAPTSAWVTIVDDDPPEVGFSTDAADVAEGGGLFAASVVVRGSLDHDVTVDYATADGTATAGADYQATSGTLTIPAGQTHVHFGVPIIDDDVSEDAETFSIVLLNPVGISLGAISATQVTILDDDQTAQIDAARFGLDLSGCSPQLEAQQDAVASPDGSDVVITVTVDNPDPAPDWQSDPVTIASGAAFSVDLQQVEPGASLTVTAQAAAGGDPATATVANVPTAPPSIDSRWVMVAGTGEMTVPVTAITDRVNTISLRIDNTAQSLSATIPDPCPGTAASGTIQGNEGDELTLTACNGSVAPVCSDPVPIGRLPSYGVQPVDIGPAGVVGLSRDDATILVATDQNEGRMIALDAPDPWTPNLYPWHIPSPYGAMGHVIDRGNWGLSWVEGSHLLSWDSGNGLWADSEPIGAGVPIDGVLRQGDHLFFVGHDTTGSYFSSAVENGSNGGLVCSPGTVVTLNSSSTADPLALIPLPGPYVGVVTSSDSASDRVLVVDVSNPASPVQVTDRTVTLDGLSQAISRADVEDDFLAVWTVDGTVRLYRLFSDGLWPNGQPGLVSLQDKMTVPPSGRTILAVTRDPYDGMLLAGLNDGTLVNSGGTTEYVLPNGPIIGLVETHDMIYVGTFGGLYLINEAEDYGLSVAELHRTRIRMEVDTLHFASNAVTSSVGGASVEIGGTGTDVEGNPLNVAFTVDAPGPWQPFDVQLPSSYGGADNVLWETVTSKDRGYYDFGETLDLQADLNLGPAFFDPHCESGIHACAADLA
ncbi:MAG: hypothetical protein GXP48_04225, partial [Acidobacteria bacterium]|nr:hypothetical protein [Acidobacteriota bacterium]